MKKTSKALLLSLCAVVLVTASVLGTMAYLTDTTEDVVNTFTVGNVTLGGDLQEGLDESKVDEYGVQTDDGVTRVLGNSYKLVPGQTYTKDPTVHVANDSEDSYIFVKVQNGIADFEAETVGGGYTNIADQIEANEWIALSGHEGIYYKVFEQPDSEDGYTDLAVFEEFKLADDAQDVEGWDTIDRQQITIKAYAVQKEGFASAEAAWTAAAFTD